METLISEGEKRKTVDGIHRVIIILGAGKVKVSRSVAFNNNNSNIINYNLADTMAENEKTTDIQQRPNRWSTWCCLAALEVERKDMENHV